MGPVAGAATGADAIVEVRVDTGAGVQTCFPESAHLMNYY